MIRAINILTGEEIKREYKLTEEHKKHIRESKKGKKRPPFSEEWRRNIGKTQKGRKHSKEHRMKNSEVHMGHIVSEETRKKMRKPHKSISHKGIKFSDEYKRKTGKSNKGRILSEEHKEKIRIARMKQEPIWISEQEYEIREQLDKQGIPHKSNFCIKGLISPPYHYHRWDEVLEDKKILIEVQGCYFHGCKICYPTPNTKDIRLINNIKRDKIIIPEARSKGWKVIEIWEHTILESEILFKL